MPPKRSKPALLSTTLLLLLPLLLPTTQAWTFIWTDSKGSTTVEPGNWDKLGHPCKEIDHPQGGWYEFDAEDDEDITIYMYSSKDCTGQVKGYASHLKEGNSSVALRSYEVVDEAARSSSSSTFSTATSTSTSTSTGMPTTPTPTPDDEGSGSDTDSDSISPGAIGGIVAGVVVGAGVIGAIIYLARQRRKESSGPGYNSVSASASNPGPSPGPGPPTRSQTTGSNMVAAPYAQNNREPYSPTAIDTYAHSQQPVAYSPLESAHPGGQGGWPAKSPVYGPDAVSGTPPGYMQHQHHHGQGRQFTAELDGGAELQELSSTQIVNEIDGRSRGGSVYYGDRKG